MRHYLVALSPNPPKDTLQFLLCGPGEETGQHVPDHRLGRVQVRSGTVRGIFASLPERPRRSPSGFSSLASTRPAMNRFCQRSNVALVEIARQPDRQIVLVFDTSYQRQNLRLDQTREDEIPFYVKRATSGKMSGPIRETLQQMQARNPGQTQAEIPLPRFE